MIPFLIQLRRWVGKDLPAPEHWLTYVARSIAGAMPSGWVHRQLQTGALVLIDGLDELPDAERERVRDWLQGLLANAKNSRFIVTSRPAAAEEGWLRDEGFDDSQLQAMERNQIDALINQWHVAARKQISDEEILENIDQYQETLRGTVHSDRSIRNLATSPLLCAMLCLLNVDRRTKIPKDRMALYRIALETLARREAERETDSVGPVELTERQRELALEELAYWLIRNDRSDATRVESEGVVADTLPQLAGERTQVVQYLLERSGLLREPVVDRLDFIHRTFQEYLAAKRMIAAHDVGVLLSHAHEPNWREVVILATGHASDGGEAILRGLLDRADKEPKNRHYVSLLAVSCLETATAFSDQIRESIRERLGELVPPKNITEAKELASAGEIAVPYLANHTTAKVQYTAACVRALAVIGSDAALDVMVQYAADWRHGVIEEILRAGDNFDFPEYARKILSRRREVSVPRGVEDLTPLAGMTALQSLDLAGCSRVTDLKPIAGLSTLKSLNLMRCKGVIDLNPIAGLTALRRLNLSDCEHLSDLTPVATLTALQRLNIDGCAGGGDLTPLAGLTALEKLDMANLEGVTHLTSLAGLTGLRTLNLSQCAGVTDLTPLASLTALQSLNLSTCTGVTDLTPLAGPTALQSLNLSTCTGVIDLKPLAGLTALQALHMWKCTGVTDLTPLAGLTGLRTLNLWSCTGVTDLTPLAGLTALQSLDLDGCSGVTDLTSLAGLTALERLDIAHCTGVTDLTPLAGLISLRSVRVSDPKLIDAGPPDLRRRLFGPTS